MDKSDFQVLGIISLVFLAGFGSSFLYFEYQENKWDPAFMDHVCIIDGFYKGQNATILGKEWPLPFSDRDYFVVLDQTTIILPDTIDKSEMEKC